MRYINKIPHFLLSLLCVLFLAIGHADPLPNAQEVHQQIRSADWHPQKIAPGIIFKQAHFDNFLGAPQSISIVEVDLHRKNIKLGVAADPTRLIPTSQFALQNSAIAAINGTFFSFKGGSTMLVKSAGTLIYPTHNYTERSNGAVIFDKNEATIISANPGDKNWKNYLAAPDVMVSGPLLMQNGEPTKLSDAAFNRLSHPRSAIAITHKKRLLLVTVDGRNPQAGGMSLFSFAALLENLDAKDALNLDGGGSTTLYVKGQGKNGVVNYPSDNKKFDHEGERKVASAIFVSEDAQKEGEK